MKFMRASTVIASLLAACAAANGHDFWIQPASYRAEVKTPINLHLRVGDDMPGEAVVRRPDRIKQFMMIAPDGTQSPVVGVDGRDPAGIMRAETPGVYTLVYISNPSHVSLDADKFTAYLREEGLESVVADRESRGESSAAGSEAYSRCAKTFVRVGDAKAVAATETSWSKPVGMRLELVPLDNPLHVKAGQTLRVRLLSDGKPLSGILVGAHTAKPAPGTSARTDDNGEAMLELSAQGVWVINAVEMIRSEKADLPADFPEHQWRSYWASLSIDVLPATE
jgi:uncharacterized GH25 family protein